MKIQSLRSILAAAISGMLLLAANTHATEWVYDPSTRTIKHNDTQWVLNVTAHGTQLTITNVAPRANNPTTLPLADPVRDGYTITAIASATSEAHGVFAESNFNYNYISSLTLPSTLTTIGDYAFYRCHGLGGTLTIPNSVTTIGDYAFADCSPLTGTLTIPNSVTTIGDYAFRGCSRLTGALTIPNSVTNIGSGAFASCDDLTEISVAPDNPNYTSINNVLFNKSVTTLIQCLARKTGAYSIPDSVTTIGDYAFADCDSLTGVTFGDSVTTIGDYAFYRCYRLTGTLTIPNSVTTIGDYAFGSCDRLTGVTIGNSVTHIGNCAFAACDDLMTVIFEGRCPATGYYSPFASSLYVTSYIIQDHIAEWEAEITGSLKSGTAQWQGCPSRLFDLFITPSSLSFGLGASSRTFTVSSSMAWTVTDYDSWLTVNPASSTGNKIVTVTATENTGTASRIATITIMCSGVTRTITATQAGRDSGGGNGPPNAKTLTPAAATYVGYALTDEGMVGGTVTLTAKASVKVDKNTGAATTNWTFSGKAILQDTSISLSGKAVGVLDAITITPRGAELNIVFNEDGEGFTGVLSVSKSGVSMEVVCVRDTFANKTDKQAEARLGKVLGYYTVALLDAEAAGYLTLTISKLGSVKFAGKLMDGTAVSGSTKLLEGLHATDDSLGIVLHKPLYSKKGNIGGVLWLDTTNKVLRVEAAYGWPINWVCTEPKKSMTLEAFENSLDVCGGYFGTGKVAAYPLTPPYVFDVILPAYMPSPDQATDGDWVSEAFPSGLSVKTDVAKSTLSLEKGKAPAKAKVGTGEDPYYDYEASANPAVATLSYTAKTGIFKGGFKLYFDGMKNGKLQHKTASVTYVGVMVPVRDDAFAAAPAGLGSGAVKIGKEKVGIGVVLE